MKYKESEEMYLETILLLKQKNNQFRSIDVANELNYSRASVSREASEPLVIRYSSRVKGMPSYVFSSLAVTKERGRFSTFNEPVL